MQVWAQIIEELGYDKQYAEIVSEANRGMITFAS
jgi:hypothetical protein